MFIKYFYKWSFDIVNVISSLEFCTIDLFETENEYVYRGIEFVWLYAVIYYLSDCIVRVHEQTRTACVLKRRLHVFAENRYLPEQIHGYTTNSDMPIDSCNIQRFRIYKVSHTIQKS